jgi:hypothetical protein
MFGLFKKQITVAEFGQGIIHLANGPISSDCNRALAMRFAGWGDHDGSKGWSSFLERKGISIPIQKLHFRLWSHCAVQVTCTQFDGTMRRTITQSAMEGFSEKLGGYDFATTYDALEAAYRGQYKFDPKVEPLNNPNATIHYLPNQRIGVLNAKYLVEKFAIPYMPNKSAFIDEFQSYSSTVCASIGTVSRAMNHILAKFKL